MSERGKIDVRALAEKYRQSLSPQEREQMARVRVERDVPMPTSCPVPDTRPRTGSEVAARYRCLAEERGGRGGPRSRGRGPAPSRTPDKPAPSRSEQERGGPER